MLVVTLFLCVRSTWECGYSIEVYHTFLQGVRWLTNDVLFQSYLWYNSIIELSVYGPINERVLTIVTGVTPTMFGCHNVISDKSGDLLMWLCRRELCAALT